MVSDKSSNKFLPEGGMHLKVICSICEKNAEYNSTLGIYYCPEHGYETKLEEQSEYLDELVTNLEQLKIFV